jgi:hypothetical protein
MLAKKNQLAFINALLVATGALMLSACGSETPKEGAVAAPLEDSTEIAIESNESSYLLPSPLQIASIFKKSGLKYKEGVTSSFKNPEKYTTNLSKALNLGVYSADLSYSVLNKQSQEAMNFIKLSKTLSENLGISSVFDQGNLSKRFEKNIGNEDSLAYIIAELQMFTDMYLDENDQQYISSIVFAGAWVESMHIGANVLGKEKDQSLNLKLSEQMTILKIIIGSLKSYEKKDAAISGIISDLEGLKSIYDALPSIKNANQKDENDETVIALTNEEVSALTTKIEELRNKIING